jgi:hypothetical protein
VGNSSTILPYSGATRCGAARRVERGAAALPSRVAGWKGRVGVHLARAAPLGGEVDHDELVAGVLRRMTEVEARSSSRMAEVKARSSSAAGAHDTPAGLQSIKGRGAMASRAGGRNLERRVEVIQRRELLYVAGRFQRTRPRTVGEAARAGPTAG